MGKYDRLKGKLSQFVNMEYRDKVDEVRLTYTHLSYPELHAEYASQRKVKADIEETLSDVDLNLKALTEMLIEHMDANDITSITNAEGYTIRMSIVPNVVVEEVDQYQDFIDAHTEYQYMWGIHPQKTLSLVKDLLDKGLDDQLPPGLKVTLRTGLTFTKK